MRMRIIPTKNLCCWAVARTPASPTIPIANPAARPLNPTDKPAPSWRNDLCVCVCVCHSNINSGVKFQLIQPHAPYVESV